jgi:hypothetical protein
MGHRGCGDVAVSPRAGNSENSKKVSDLSLGRGHEDFVKALVVARTGEGEHDRGNPSLGKVCTTQQLSYTLSYTGRRVRDATTSITTPSRITRLFSTGKSGSNCQLVIVRCYNLNHLFKSW